MLTEWDEGFADICNVKHGHPEKTSHPAQYPIELAERCVLLLSKPGDMVLDPFAGTGTTALAASLHGRHWCCMEQEKDYEGIFRQRLDKLKKGTLPYKPLGALLRKYNDKRSQLSQEQVQEWRALLGKRKRIVETAHDRDYRYEDV